LLEKYADYWDKSEWGSLADDSVWIVFDHPKQFFALNKAFTGYEITPLWILGRLCQEHPQEVTRDKVTTNRPWRRGLRAFDIMQQAQAAGKAASAVFHPNYMTFVTVKRFLLVLQSRCASYVIYPCSLSAPPGSDGRLPQLLSRPPQFAWCRYPVLLR
jgi:hypothetical protein